MKQVVATFLSLLLLAACNFSSKNPSSSDDIRKPAISDVERLSPLKYLDFKSNCVLVGKNKIIIDGRVTSYASLANYKDVTIQVFCINDKGDIVKREKIIVFNLITHGSSLPFKISTLAADSTQKAIVKLFDATGVK